MWGANCFEKLYGSEGLTQVYAFMVEYLASLPKVDKENIIEIMYDDACHFKKFCENDENAKKNEVTHLMEKIGKHVVKVGCLNSLAPVPLSSASLTTHSS